MNVIQNKKNGFIEVEQYQRLEEENRELRIKLTEAEDTLSAISQGAIDAVVVQMPEGHKVFTLEGADHAYRIFIETMQEGAITASADLNVMFCNKRFSQMIRLPAEKILGSPINKCIHREDLTNFEAIISKGFKETSRGEVRMITGDGAILDVLVSCNPLKLEIQGICIVFTELTELKKVQGQLERANSRLGDLVAERTRELLNTNKSLELEIEERKKAELSLKESQEKLNLALENGSIGVWSWNMVTNEMDWDHRLEGMFHFCTGEPKTFETFESKLLDEDIPHVRNAIKNALEKDVPLETIFRVKSSDPCEFNYISVKAHVKRNDEGKPVKMSGVGFDITAMKKGAEQSMFKLNEELLRSNKELQQFAYVASHDLQEPLRMVSSFTQLLYNRYYDKLDDSGKDFIKFAVDGANRMYALINDLLAFSRIQTKGKPFESISTEKAFENAIFNLKGSIEEKHAIITKDSLPAIYADNHQIIQLFQNLIGNAIKFCNEEPQIHVGCIEKAGEFVFSVRDNGIGIAPEYFDRIFQIFQRLQPKEEYGGTGIGLAICKRIVERHGGNIWLESEPGKGSVFYFSIPK